MEKESKRIRKKKPSTTRKKRPSQKVPAKKTGNKKRQHHNKKTKRKKQPVKNYLKELIVAISLSVVLILVFSSFFLTIVTVHGFSMIPTLREKIRFLFKKQLTSNGLI